MTRKSIEDSYCLRDAEHTNGTNKYTFKYNFQWRNIIHEHLTISVRSVKLWLAPRHLWVEGLQVNTTGTDSTGFNTTITGSMSEFNDKLSKMGDAVGYKVYYNPTNQRLVFDCADGNYFNYTSIESMTIKMSKDLRVITGIEWLDENTPEFNDNDTVDFSSASVSAPNIEVLHQNSDNYIDSFCFNNVWDRENVHISGSFVDLGYKNFLGVSNEQFIPPKEYPISFTDQKFTIELYDSTEKPIEIPSLDNKDTLLIEMTLNSYT